MSTIDNRGQGIKLVTKYALFAAIATLVNVFFQHISFYFYRGIYSLYIAMALGTVAGLIVKYLLDKKYIFYYKTKNSLQDVQKVIIYTLMGVVTTFIFWGTELLFNAIWNYDLSKYIGAVVGLTIGYIIKYQLDNRYVFNHYVESNLKNKRQLL